MYIAVSLYRKNVMKKIILIVLVVFISIGSYSQKKKAASNTKSTSALAKIDNLTAEIKSGNFQLAISENGKPKDVIVIKAADAKFIPTDCKLIAFKANGAQLHLLTWSEKTTTKTDLKTENSTTVNSKIFEINSKAEVFSNYQITNLIVEIVFLDRLKNASETQERIRREGFEFILNADGSILQKNKTQELKWIYDVKGVKYNEVKKKK